MLKEASALLEFLLIARYIMDNPTEYVFSSLTASVDGEISFEPLGNNPKGNVGTAIDTHAVSNCNQ